MIRDWFQQIEFAHPWYFLLLGLLPLAIWRYAASRGGKGSFMVSSVGAFGGGGNWKIALRHLPFILRMLCLVCLVLALARPRTSADERFLRGDGLDIVLCMDVSGSMMAQDLLPNRLEAAKEVAAKFVDDRPADRIGLVIFSGESFTQCPVTTDRVVLKNQIFNMQTGLLEPGTAIGSGLATSVDRLKNSSAKSKVVVLLTDGENNGGLIDPQAAKEIAKSVGVRVYTIGVGTDGFAPVPVQTTLGVVMRNEKVNIDEKLLQQIATETGGKYFRAKDNNGLKEIYTEIDQLEKSKVEISALRRYTEKFHILAMAALAFLLIELLLRYTVYRSFP